MSSYSEHKPTERLLGTGIEAAHVNDDGVGRAPDAFVPVLEGEGQHLFTPLVRPLLALLGIRRNGLERQARIEEERMELAVRADLLRIGRTARGHFRPSISLLAESHLPSGGRGKAYPDNHKMNALTVTSRLGRMSAAAPKSRCGIRAPRDRQ